MQGIRTEEANNERLISGLALYRRLLSIPAIQRSEKELIQAIVDALWESFPEHRVGYSTISPEGRLRVHYTRQAEGQRRLDGVEMDFALVPEYHERLLREKVVAIDDYRTLPGYGPLLEATLKLGSRSRLDCLVVEEGNIGMLTFSNPEVYLWDDFARETIREVAELIRLMLGKARAHAKIIADETMFRQFAENIRSVFWMTSPNKNEMIYISPAYEEVWGRSTASLYADPASFLEGIHPDDRQRVLVSVQNQISRRYEEIYRVIRPDGTMRWVRDRAFIVHNEAGEPYRIVGFAEDISDLREAQRRLEATQAQVVSNAKFAALGEMASGIAHEINNPLAVIHGLTLQLREICRQPVPGPKVQITESLATIEKMSKRIADVVKGLRTFSRQTEGDPFVTADFTGIVHETLALFAAKSRDAKITLDFHPPKQPLYVRCRPAELSQVLLNLLNNAVDAVAHAAEKKITLGVIPDKIFLRFFVEDSGPGIPAAIRDKVFQPFFTTKEVGKGTGLGLSISMGIVEGHSGSLRVDETAERTRFLLELELEKE